MRKSAFGTGENGPLRVCHELATRSEGGKTWREQTQVNSLLHVPGETRLFAGLSNGALVSVDLASGEIGSRAELGDGDWVASDVGSNFKSSNGWFFYRLVSCSMPINFSKKHLPEENAPPVPLAKAKAL